MVAVLLVGFTAAQLSTEPVGKILAEEPAAGGIDIGEAFKLLIWMSVSLLVLMVFRLIHSKSLVSSQLLSNFDHFRISTAGGQQGGRPRAREEDCQPASTYCQLQRP